MYGISIIIEIFPLSKIITTWKSEKFVILSGFSDNNEKRQHGQIDMQSIRYHDMYYIA